MKSNVATRPARNDTWRTVPIRAEIASATVTSSTSAPAARVALFGLPGVVCHTSACTIRKTFSNDRVARSSANPATKNEKTRCPVERSPIPAKAFAAKPPIPASRARLPGSSLAALAPRPKITTSRNTYGIMNRNTRNATAPASTPPPAATSRSNAPSAVSMSLEFGRFCSSCSRARWIRPTARACSSFSRSMRDRVIASSVSSPDGGCTSVTWHAPLRCARQRLPARAWRDRPWSGRRGTGRTTRWRDRADHRRRGSRRWRRDRPTVREPVPTSHRTASRSGRARPVEAGRSTPSPSCHAAGARRRASRTHRRPISRVRTPTPRVRGETDTSASLIWGSLDPRLRRTPGPGTRWSAWRRDRAP